MNKFIDFSNLTDEPVQTDGPYYYDSTNLLTVNVYDTIANKTVNIFNNIPSDYYTGVWSNNTRGNIVVTAYRTVASENWGFKWYRYDARGRVIKMWHQIDGLTGMQTKITEYYYNSSNQMIYTKYQPGGGDYKLTRNMLDDAGRLSAVDYWNQPTQPDTNDADNPSNWPNFTSFTYNQNSQILRQSFNGFGKEINWDYSYNSRNWISAYEEDPADDPGNPSGIFKYNLSYEPNGNISNQVLNGSYKDNFTVTNYLSFQYTYDLSNRLRIVDELNIGGKAYHLENTYDKDGNIITLERFNGSGSQTDDFTYTYYTGQGGIKTNKLRKVSGSTDQFTYDANGNMISDALNSNTNIQYDHRNLITQIQRLNTTIEPIQNQLTLYRYDDAGNRIRKSIFENTDPEALPIINIDNPSGGWVIQSEEYYSRGADGLELAIYKNTGSGAELKQHNIFAGSDNTGKLTPENGHQYYIKDHLGSIRVIIDPDRQVLSANDYDAWGYYLDGRGYEQTLNYETPNYKFTSKERDRESNYDYFGARYYDSRIGRWGQVEPLMDKYVSFSTYSYGLNNPFGVVDPDGRDGIALIDHENKIININVNIYYVNNSKSRFGFNNEEFQKLESYINEANENWNKAGEHIEYKGEDWVVKFNIKLIPVSSYSIMNEYQSLYKGSNFAISQKYFKDENGKEISNIPAGVKGDLLYIYKPKGGKFTGSHEIGHLLGLTHPADYKNQDHADLMSYGRNKNGPRDFNIRLIIDFLDFNSKDPQYIQGASEDEN